SGFGLIPTGFLPDFCPLQGSLPECSPASGYPCLCAVWNRQNQEPPPNGLRLPASPLLSPPASFSQILLPVQQPALPQRQIPKTARRCSLPALLPPPLPAPEFR